MTVEMSTLTINDTVFEIVDATARSDAGDALEIANNVVGIIEDEVTLQVDGAKADIVTEIINQLSGLPVFGTVDDENTITVTSALSDGVYVLMYENEDGTLEEIGTITIENGGVEVVNLLPTALTPNDITTVFNGIGYMNGKYASAAEPYYNNDSAFFCTGLMPIPESKLFYVSGCTFDTSLSHTRFGMMEEDGSLVNTATISSWASNGVTITVTQLGDQYYSINIGDTSALSAIPYYFYFSASGTGENVIISETPIQ